MIISKVILNNRIYYHLHAEQTITSAFADGGSMGIYEQLLTDSTLNKIIENYNNIEGQKPELLILNFDLINAIQNNQLAKISELRNLNSYLILINVKKEIIKELGLNSLFRNTNNVIDNDGNYTVFYCFEKEKFDFLNKTQDIFQEYFYQLLRSKYISDLEGKHRFHSSSYVYLSKWINIKKFISLDSEFFLYAIYQLAVKTAVKWYMKDGFNLVKDRPVLVCQNLSSSYITSVLSTLLRTDIIILDQIGPINKLYSTLDSKIENGKSYLVVSDLVCLGTEIKIAKSLIEFLGGKYEGNISIVRIQTINPEYIEFDDAVCVFTIDKNNSKELEYRIYTDLD